jgi:Zn-dependent protease with chaperone function
MNLAPALRSPKERPLFILGVIFSSIVWGVLTLATLGFGLVYAVFIAAFLLIAHALFLAHVKGNGVRVSERQLPELFARVKQAAATLGMQEVPQVYLLQQGGLLNAFATKLLSRKFVIILSDLADQCEDPRQLDFIVGHELGHFAAGHLAWNAFLAPYRLFPLLGAAYSRAREYTCDRCGHAVTGDFDASKRALVVLAAGGKHAARVNLDAFIEQHSETGGFWMAIYELVSSHPYLCKRVAELKNLEAPGSVRVAPRNPLSYPLAPILGGLAISGGGAGSALMIVAIIGVLAAIAIPNFTKYQEQARAAAQLQEQQIQEEALLQQQLLEENEATETDQAAEEDSAEPTPAARRGLP